MRRALENDTSTRAKQRLWQNVLANWSAFLVSALIAFFLSPFIVYRLGNSAYGAWVLLGSLVGYMSLLDLGVRGAVTRFVAKFHSEGNHDKASCLTYSALILFSISGILIVSLSCLMSIFLARFFHIPPEFLSEARVVIILGGVTLAVSLMNGVSEGSIVGLQRFDYVSYIAITSEILRALLVIVALSTGQGLIALACIHLGMALVRGVLAYKISRQVYPELTLRTSNWHPQYIRLIFSFSVYTVLLSVSGQLIMHTDSVVISAFLPVALLTWYSIGQSLMTYARSILYSITMTFTPMISALKAQGKTHEIHEKVLKGARFSTLVSLPIAITFMIRGESFIGLWMGPQYAMLAGDILWVLSLLLWIEGGYGIVTCTLLGLNRHKQIVPFAIAEAVINLGLSIWLVQQYGIVGVAWGTCIPRLVNGLLVGPWYLWRILGIKAGSYWLNALVRPTISVLPFTVGSYLIEQAWSASGMAVFFLQVGTVLPFAGLGAWYIGLTTTERSNYRHWLRQRVGRIVPTVS